MELTFVTTNTVKFQLAETMLAPYGIRVRQEIFETPEIQSLDIREVATFSANYMQEKLKRPLILTDSGYGFTALNGFPGALVKYFNHIHAADIANLLAAHTNREMVMEECLAYSVPGQEVQLFVSTQKGSAALQPQGQGTSIEQFYIPAGHSTPMACLSRAEHITHWQNTLTHYQQLGAFLAR